MSTDVARARGGYLWCFGKIDHKFLQRLMYCRPFSKARVLNKMLLKTDMQVYVRYATYRHAPRQRYPSTLSPLQTKPVVLLFLERAVLQFGGGVRLDDPQIPEGASRKLPEV